MGQQFYVSLMGCTDADTVPKPPWKERKEAYIEHIQNATSDIRFVSCCDKLHNARANLTDYLAIGDDLWGDLMPVKKIFSGTTVHWLTHSKQEEHLH